MVAHAVKSLARFSWLAGGMWVEFTYVLCSQQGTN